LHPGTHGVLERGRVKEGQLKEGEAGTHTERAKERGDK